ncbi:hypothetical protein GOV12_02560 [Candidatus Pacearchaeota archaeon]|nr:hypothetical protein [Candidatus Pacearchaeota archaeon]
MVNKINKFITKNARICYLQIFILVLASVSFSYLISDNFVTAQSRSPGCCEKTKDGAWCQDVSDVNDCSEELDESGNRYSKSPTECSNTDYCKLGCCVSSQTGVCNKNTPKLLCSAEEFKDNSNCDISECQKGCCILGDNSMWTSEKNCLVESGFRGIPIDFSKEVKSELECIFSVEKDKLGACVFDDDNRGCKYITLDECNNRLNIRSGINSNFFSGKYCSLNELNTSCSAKDHKGCLEGKEDVYWFDSCNNPEDIALDCDLYNSNYCGNSGSEYICRDLSCETDSGSRKNGESWCSYDEVIGNGKDMVGSRHVRHYCFMGEEKIEPCSDYRNEICVEESIEFRSDKISQSACRVNNWRSCFSYGTMDEDEMVEKCEKNPDCYINDVNVDSQFKFKLCVPNYPPGFELKLDVEQIMNEDYQSSAENICKMGNQECTVVEVCSLFGGCKVKVNKNCLTKKFSNEMNDFCVSLGDCGGYVNYNNDVSNEGYHITTDRSKRPPFLTDSDIISMKGDAGEKPALPGDLDFLGALGVQENIDNYAAVYNSSNVLENELMGISGAMGSSLLVKILTDEVTGDIGRVSSNTKPSVIDFSKFTNAFATIKAGTTVKYKLKTFMGAPMGSLIGGVIGGVIGTLAFGLIGGLILGLILFFIFFQKVKITHINYKCMPWQAPIEGDCEVCNDDKFCTEYRCSSLGYNCELINKGTLQEICISKDIETSVPEITPWEDLISPGYSYLEINTEGFSVVNSTNNGCIPAFTNVRFGIKTVNKEEGLEFTQCKFDLDASKTYEEMVDFFDEYHPNAYLPYHRRNIILPSPDALRFQYNATEEEIRKLGEIKMYIRCKNLKGVQNLNPFEVSVCVYPGPDHTSPYIVTSNPENKGKLGYGVDSQDVTLFVNEPALCKWSTQDKGYNDMENSIDCDNSLENYTAYGFKCNTRFTGLSSNSKFYVKCQDLSPNSNTMTESYVYELFSSQNPLKISDIRPLLNTEIYTGVEPIPITLRLETVGGSKNGQAICEWEGNNFGPDLFTETDSNFHSYEWEYAMSGAYNINFKCEDSAGDEAINSTRFSIIIDNNYPRISRIYNDGGLKIITSEEAECRYSFDRMFDFDNASVMTGDFEHRAEWVLDEYFIQCEDIYGNKPSTITKVKTY